ncbi:MAG TPA: ABC transporter substrate-binding protein [Dehalococcoidia bacterium]|nr:ABC transporter substrate-binding protein [Dehalococcoidia bacterium]
MASPNPFQGMNFSRMGTIYRSFSQMADSFETIGKSTNNPGLVNLAKAYRDGILSQMRGWINEETTRTNGFPIEFTHEQLMLEGFGLEAPGHGSAGTPDTSQHASATVPPEAAHPILNSTAVRQAFAASFDRNTLQQNTELLNTWGKGYAQHLSTGSPDAFNAFETQVFAFDPEVADRLLTEAGWVKGPDGVRVAEGALYAGGELLSFQPGPTPTELDALASAAANLPGSDPQSRAELYAQIESEYFGDSPSFATWSAAVLPYYSRAMFDQAGVEYPPQPEKWTWAKVAELAKLLTVDAEGRNALDPDFDPQRVQQAGPGWSLPAKIGGAAAGIVIVVGAVFGGIQVFGGDDGGGNDTPIVVNDPSGLGAQNQTIRYDGIISPSWLIEAAFTRSDDPFTIPVAGGGDLIFVDPLGDPFTSFPQEPSGGWVTLGGVEYWDMTQSAGAIIDLDGGDGTAPLLDCGQNPPPGGYQLICPEGATGGVPPGAFGVVAITIDGDLATRQDGLEYRYDVFVDTKSVPVYVNNPAFPYDTAQSTTYYAEILSTGAGPWSIRQRVFDGQRFQDAPVAAPYDRVRAVVEGDTINFVFPRELLGDGPLWRSTTNVHTAGVNYAPGNVTLDTIGADSKEPLAPFIDFTAALPADGLPDDQARLMVALQDYAAWVQQGNGDQLFSHLDETGKDHYGEETCADYFASVSEEPSFGFVVHSISGPAEWEWVYNNETVGSVPDAYTLNVTLLQRNVVHQADVHFALDDGGELRVFSPCVVASAPPTAAVPAGPTPPPGPSAEVEQTLRAGMGTYEAARKVKDSDTLFGLLHPVVLAFYGEDACRTFYNSGVGADPNFAFGAISSITGPAPYTYAPGGVTVGTADAYTIVVETTVSGQTQPVTWHFAIVDGQFKVLQPCGR